MFSNQNKLLFLFLFFLFTSNLFVKAQDFLPEGYQLLYAVDFDDEPGLAGFEMTDPKAWRIGTLDGSKTLELFGSSQYEPKVRSPKNIAMIKDLQFGSFILEANVKQTGKEYGHRDMCLFFGMKDPSNFYYVHIATTPDPHAHNIFLVNDAPRVAIGEKVSNGVNWGQGWHKVRLVRNAEEGSIQLFYDDMTTPIMESKDTHFGAGFIGFGSFDDTGMIDNIKIYGKEAHTINRFFKN